MYSFGREWGFLYPDPIIPLPDQQLCCRLIFCFQDSFYSLALKSLITVSTLILLGLIVAYHALEVQVSISSVAHSSPSISRLVYPWTTPIPSECMQISLIYVRHSHHYWQYLQITHAGRSHQERRMLTDHLNRHYGNIITTWIYHASWQLDWCCFASPNHSQHQGSRAHQHVNVKLTHSVLTPCFPTRIYMSDDLNLLTFSNICLKFDWKLNERPVRIILSRSTAFLGVLLSLRARQGKLLTGV